MYRRALGILILSLISASLGFAQGTRRDGLGLAQIGNAFRPIPGGTVRVCTEPTSGAPCTTPAQLYSDIGLTSPITNPVSVAADGTYTYYAACGLIEEEIAGSGVVTKDYPNVLLPCGSSASTCPESPNLSVQYDKAGACGASGYLDYEAPNACPDGISTTCIVAMDTGGGDTIALGTDSISIYGPADSGNGASLLNVEGLQVYVTTPPPFASSAYPECGYEAESFFCMNMNGSTTITASGTAGVLEVGNTSDTAGNIFLGDGASTTCTISTDANTCPGGVHGSVLVLALPSAASSTGYEYIVTDSTSVTSEGQSCAGSSSHTALAFSDGTVWKCF